MKLNEAVARKSSHDKSNGRSDPLGSNSAIGRKLRQYYNELVSDEVPDRFADLLKQLEEHERPVSAREGD